MGDGRAYVCESCERSYSGFQRECECGGTRFITLEDRETHAAVGQAAMRASFTAMTFVPRVVVNSWESVTS